MHEYIIIIKPNISNIKGKMPYIGLLKFACYCYLQLYNSLLKSLRLWETYEHDSLYRDLNHGPLTTGRSATRPSSGHITFYLLSQ